MFKEEVEQAHLIGDLHVRAKLQQHHGCAAVTARDCPQQWRATVLRNQCQR